MALIPERRDPDPMQEGGSLLVLAPLAFVLGGTSGSGGSSLSDGPGVGRPAPGFYH